MFQIMTGAKQLRPCSPTQYCTAWLEIVHHNCCLIRIHIWRTRLERADKWLGGNRGLGWGDEYGGRSPPCKDWHSPLPLPNVYLYFSGRPVQSRMCSPPVFLSCQQKLHIYFKGICIYWLQLLMMVKLQGLATLIFEWTKKLCSSYTTVELYISITAGIFLAALRAFREL